MFVSSVSCAYDYNIYAIALRVGSNRWSQLRRVAASMTKVVMLFSVAVTAIRFLLNRLLIIPNDSGHTTKTRYILLSIVDNTHTHTPYTQSRSIRARD